MRRLLLLTIVGLSLYSCMQQVDTDLVTVYYFIRHAEKDRSDPQNNNPELTAAGGERAQKWAEVFQDVAFDAVYSTDYKRTVQTAEPTARKNNIKITLYDPKTLSVSAFINDTRGKSVLIVGHSNTTPELVNRFLGKSKYPPIADDNNANLYMITLTHDKISDVLLKIP